MVKLTLKGMIESLSLVAEESPELLDKPVVTSIDEEGKKFVYVYFPPSRGAIDDSMRFDDGVKKFNTVCLN